MAHDFQMLDLNDPETPVEILISRDGRLWVNVDGKCALRIHGGTYNIEDDRFQGGTYTSEEPHALELPPTDKASMPMPMSLMHFLAEISADEAEELHEWMDGDLTAVDRFLDGLAAKYRDPEPPEHYGEPPPSPEEVAEQLEKIKDEHKR